MKETVKSAVKQIKGWVPTIRFLDAVLQRTHLKGRLTCLLFYVCSWLRIWKLHQNTWKCEYTLIGNAVKSKSAYPIHRYVVVCAIFPCPIALHTTVVWYDGDFIWELLSLGDRPLMKTTSCQFSVLHLLPVLTVLYHYCSFIVCVLNNRSDEGSLEYSCMMLLEDVTLLELCTCMNSFLMWNIYRALSLDHSQWAWTAYLLAHRCLESLYSYGIVAR